MNTRPLSQIESDNLTALNEAGMPSTLLFITATGLEKAILDATDPMRDMFRRNHIHDYADQAQGPAAKRLLKAFIVDDTGRHEVELSLYRPVTKSGDPRMWFYGLGRYASADDAFSVFVWNGSVHAINLTKTSLATAKGRNTPLGQLFGPLWAQAVSVAEELLARLRSISASGLIRATCTGPTAIGRSIETALGIDINSNRLPDYKGIEIKSGRSSLTKRATRATLFACVPDWTLSNLKSSAQILDRYGYARGEVFKLYCTVSARRENSQGLQLTVDAAQRWLREVFVKEPSEEVVVWRMATLDERLSGKHRETFWVRAEVEHVNGHEHFRLRSVTHTRNPNLPQLERMLGDGTITLDHLIKRMPDGRTSEKGPLFKIEHHRIRELFLGEPKQYALDS